MRRSSRYIGRLVGLVSLMLISLCSPKQIAQSATVYPFQFDQWPCAKDFVAKEGSSAVVMHRNSKEIMKSVERSSPLEAPCCSRGISIKGNVTVSVLIDQKGNLQCAKGETGNPIAVASAIASLPKWHFRPYHKNGLTMIVVGQLILRYDFSKE